MITFLVQRKGGAVSTVLTVGELDLCLPERFGRELAGRIPGAQFKVIEQQGHQPFQEGPAEYNELLARFWSGLPA